MVQEYLENAGGAVSIEDNMGNGTVVTVSLNPKRVQEIDGLEINRDARSVMVDGGPVRLTPIEYSILLYLAEHRGSVVAVKELFRAVWNEDFMPGSNNTVMVHIRHLREKIGDDAQKPRFIKNVWGVGYIIE